ncbi:hypothetical protein JTB14_002113 [Gonioctena quinquepunctata]|nr:hypothetical protein JTB14_002113 [Gonioctena quinquepunctata]
MTVWPKISLVHVIALAIRILTSVERAYSVTEKDCLAIVWRIEKLRSYLEAYHFGVTNHQSLTLTFDQMSCWCDLRSNIAEVD